MTNKTIKNHVNFDAEMAKIIEQEGAKRVLLHCCCAPCAAPCLEKLGGLSVECFYFNPNIFPLEEYQKRLYQLKRLCQIYSVPLHVGEYADDEFLCLVKGLENEREGGARCKICYKMRLDATAAAAKRGGFDYFCTTLTLSPLKNAALINETGFKIAKEQGINYLQSDFKKRGGYQKSIELCKKYNIYRQNYCGCSFTKPPLPLV